MDLRSRRADAQSCGARAFVEVSIDGRGRPSIECLAYAAARAASRMTAATSLGFDSIGAWPARNSVVLAFMRAARSRISFGLTILSSVVTMYQQSLDFQAACETYLEAAASYRQTALTIAARAVPEHERLSTCWGGAEAPSLTPSTVFRWVDRFARGAGAWWITLAAEAQARATEALRPQASPNHLPAKARSAAKARALNTAWHLLALLRWLLARLALASREWPHLLVFAPRKPRHCDHSGWFISARAGDKRVPP